MRALGDTAFRRGFTAVELAVGISIAGSVGAVGLVTISREMRRSHVAEAEDGLARLGAAMVERASRDHGEPVDAPASLTPSTVPRGVTVVDADDTWMHPTWRALGDFRASRPGVPHRFAFALDVVPVADAIRYVGRAHGDLDGDGMVSTFEIAGVSTKRTPEGRPSFALTPGLWVDAEVE
ncbi:MAG: type II secretion system protein [Polyangiaceae bacterium]